MKSTDYEAFSMARRLIAEEGILCGGSSGAIVYKAVQFAKENKLPSNVRIVAICPDGIRNYLSKFI